MPWATCPTPSRSVPRGFRARCGCLGIGRGPWAGWSESGCTTAPISPAGWFAPTTRRPFSISTALYVRSRSSTSARPRSRSNSVAMTTTAPRSEGDVDIDLSLLRALEREKDISFDLVVEALERALLLAYQRSEKSQPKARVELDRNTGHVTVWAQEVDEDGNVVREWDDTPEGFGRIAATTAKQEILQRLRDAEDEITFGDFLDREGDIVSGTIQQGHDPRNVMVKRGKVAAVLPAAEQVPGGRYEHGSRIRCYVLQVRKGAHGPIVTVSRSHPNLVKKLFMFEVPEIADGTVEIAGIARE